MASLFPYQKSAALLKPNLKEVLRYMASGKNPEPNIIDEAKTALRLLQENSSPKAVYTVCDTMLLKSPSLNIGFGTFESRDMYKYFNNASKTIIFAATIGIYTDMLIKRYSPISPLKALAISAAGSALIEEFCDDLCCRLKNEFAEQGFLSAPRFSPGYGDFPLECQKNILPLLQSDKTVGINLNDSMLMTPSKSVTAVIALRKDGSLV